MCMIMACKLMSNTQQGFSVILAGLMAIGLSADSCAGLNQVSQSATADYLPPQDDSRTVLPAGATKSPAPFEGDGWQDMFNGFDLSGWKETRFAGRGEVECVKGAIVAHMGDPFTGLNYTNSFPTNNYEIALDAMRVMGSDFFCALTVPVGNSHCSLIVGGWGGGLVGISSLDSMDASENETTKFVGLKSGTWYRIRVRVTNNRIEGWVDKDKLIDVNTRDRKVSVRPGDIESSKPVGLACWQTTAAYREIKMRKVSGAADPPRKGF